MYRHVKDSEKKRGKKKDKAEEIAARTVNKHRRETGRTSDSRTFGTGNPTTSLESRSLDELKARARKLNIPGYSRLRKSELLSEIRSRNA
jgi:hypothetical protein